MEIKELATALAKAQGEMKNATLNRVNPHFKSKYADLAGIIDATRGTLAKHGLCIVQATKMHPEGGCTLETILLHTSGQCIVSEYPLPSAYDKPQIMGSAITYARRYSLAAICNISADDDDDANAAQDGAKNGGPVITEKQMKELSDLADEVGADKRKFCAYLKVPSLAEVPAAKFTQAKAALEAKRPAPQMEAAE